jgi:hypothetical protein
LNELCCRPDRRFHGIIKRSRNFSLQAIALYRRLGAAVGEKKTKANNTRKLFPVLFKILSTCTKHKENGKFAFSFFIFLCFFGKAKFIHPGKLHASSCRASPYKLLQGVTFILPFLLASFCANDKKFASVLNSHFLNRDRYRLGVLEFPCHLTHERHDKVSASRCSDDLAL